MSTSTLVIIATETTSISEMRCGTWRAPRQKSRFVSNHALYDAMLELKVVTTSKASSNLRGGILVGHGKQQGHVVGRTRVREYAISLVRTLHEGYAAGYFFINEAFSSLRDLLSMILVHLLLRYVLSVVLGTMHA